MYVCVCVCVCVCGSYCRELKAPEIYNWNYSESRIDGNYQRTILEMFSASMALGEGCHRTACADTCQCTKFQMLSLHVGGSGGFHFTCKACKNVEQATYVCRFYGYGVEVLLEICPL